MRDRLVSKSRLHDAEVHGRTVDVPIRRLRLKIGADNARPC